MEIKKILFPTDFSEGSSQLLQCAVDFTKRYRAKLYILHVIYDVIKAGGWSVLYPSMAKTYQELEKSSQKEIEKFGAEELGELKNIERHIIIGIPYQEIINFVKKNKIDMIIMGTHRKKGLEKILLGSVAAEVVRYAPCPVITVRLPCASSI
jgi:nucleotide-binding universal stress UspA family protein